MQHMYACLTMTKMINAIIWQLYETNQITKRKAIVVNNLTYDCVERKFG